MPIMDAVVFPGNSRKWGGYAKNLPTCQTDLRPLPGSRSPCRRAASASQVTSAPFAVIVFRRFFTGKRFRTGRRPDQASAGYEGDRSFRRTSAPPCGAYGQGFASIRSGGGTSGGDPHVGRVWAPATVPGLS